MHQGFEFTSPISNKRGISFYNTFTFKQCSIMIVNSQRLLPIPIPLKVASLIGQLLWTTYQALTVKTCKLETYLA